MTDDTELKAHEDAVKDAAALSAAVAGAVHVVEALWAPLSGARGAEWERDLGAGMATSDHAEALNARAEAEKILILLRRIARDNEGEARERLAAHVAYTQRMAAAAEAEG